MKKIAIFSGYYFPHLGGVERYTYNLATRLTNMGDKVIIVSLRYDENLPEIEETECAKIYRLPTRKLFAERYPIVKNNKRCKELLELVKEEGIDSIILQTRFWTSSLLGAKFADKNKIPVCLIEHGSSHFTVNNKVLDFLGAHYEHWLTNQIKKRCKDFYGVSKKCTEWLKHFKIEAKGVFYNSINEEEFELYKKYIKKHDDKVVITFVGRIIAEKGVLKLINVFKKLKEKYNVELNIAGDGPILDKIKEENKEEEKIHILGKLEHEEIMQLLAETDVFIHPSSFPEGLPTSILEAGLMECAVIATPKGGTAEIINNEEIGIICGFEEEDIEKSLVEVIESKEKREKLRKNMKKEVMDKFSWKTTSKQIRDTIKYK